MKKYIFFFSFFIATFLSAYQLPINFWDGSYMYNVVSVERVHNQIYVGFKSNLGDLFYDHDGNHSDKSFESIDDYALEKTLYMVFDESECTESEQELNCVTANSNKYHQKRLFWARTIFDLDDTIRPITEIIAQSMHFSLTQNLASAKINWSADATSKFETSLGINDLDGKWGNTYFGTAFFPQRLKDYISK